MSLFKIFLIILFEVLKNVNVIIYIAIIERGVFLWRVNLN